MEKFSDFISEQKNDKPYKVVILTVEYGNKSITAKKFEKEASAGSIMLNEGDSCQVVDGVFVVCGQ